MNYPMISIVITLKKYSKKTSLPLPIRSFLFFAWMALFFLAPFVRRRSFKPATVKKLLVIQLKSLGDVIFITPALKVIRNNLPAAQIYVLTKPRAKEILSNNPYVDAILTTDVEHGGEVTLSNLVGLIHSIRQQRFDLIFDFTGDFWFSSWLAYLAGAKYRVGSRFMRQIMKVFRLNSLGWLMTHEAPADVTKYPPQYFMDQLRYLGMNVKDSSLSLIIDEKEVNFIQNFLNNKGISPSDYVVLIHPGAGWISKIWPSNNFSQLADYLIAHYQLSIVFTGIEEEQDLINFILYRMRYKSAAIAATSLRLNQFAALIARSQLVICSDTSALHLAVALGTRTVSLFGPTSAQQFVPRDDRHIAIQSPKDFSPCSFFNRRGFKHKCPFNSQAKCMKEIRVEVVIEAVIRQLSALGISKGSEINMQT